MKKGRHRRYEEARELKRSHDGDFDALLASFDDDYEDEARPEYEIKPEHAAWADEFEKELESELAGDDRSD